MPKTKRGPGSQNYPETAPPLEFLQTPSFSEPRTQNSEPRIPNPEPYGTDQVMTGAPAASGGGL
jgi:hypothetical protein